MTLTDEEAKAAQEVGKGAQEIAKTLTEYKSSIDSCGKFFGKIVGYPTIQVVGLVGDVFRIARSELLLAYKLRVEKIMKQRGMDGSSDTVALSFVHPLLEAASLEEDENISEMFAHLLVNAMDLNYSEDVPKSFIQIVKNMSPLEAQLLNAIAKVPSSATDKNGKLSPENLLNGYLDSPDVPKLDSAEKPSLEITTALTSLELSGCIETLKSEERSSSYLLVGMSNFGVELLRACSSA